MFFCVSCDAQQNIFVKRLRVSFNRVLLAIVDRRGQIVLSVVCVMLP